MTVAELIAELQKRDPSMIVAIDTFGFARGIYPAADKIENFDCGRIVGEKCSTVVLQPSEWP